MPRVTEDFRTHAVLAVMGSAPPPSDQHTLLPTSQSAALVMNALMSYHR